MRRRDLLLALASMLAIAGAARAQGKKPVIGILDWMPGTTVERLQPLRQSLRQHGLAEGQDYILDYRSAEERSDRADVLARELSARQVDVIIAIATPATHAAAKATNSIPIVMSSADPIGTGLVMSLARPGGNITGLSTMLPDLASKRLELLREIIPHLTRVGFIGSTQDPAAPLFLRETRQAAEGTGVTVIARIIADAGALERAVATLVGEGCQAIIMQPIFLTHRQRIADLQMQHRVPVISDLPVFAAAGSLLSYGPDMRDTFERMGRYVGQLLKGARPGDLPIEQPSTFRLAINLKTARALGVDIPATVIARADEVIE